jgi:serine/threonine protein kinase
MTIAVGTRLGRYKIISRLGAGGMGEVYLAEDTKLGRKVAVKLLPAQFTKDEDRVRRFAQEAKAASALNHPNIITIYEIGDVDGERFIATEFVDGMTLRRRLSEARFTVEDAIEVAAQVASALEAAHSAGIVHRDVKPENIMLRCDSIVKVLDFGLAKLTDVGDPSMDSGAPTLPVVETVSGTVLGTVDYMSPEQARGHELDERTDIWSLGVVLYEMVAGQRPFQGDTRNDVIAAILRTEPVPLTSGNEPVPVELQRIVKKALRPWADERYQTVKELLIDLKNLKKEREFAAQLDRITPEPPVLRTDGTTDSATTSALTVERFSIRQALIVLPAALLIISAVWLVVWRGHLTEEISPFGLKIVDVVSWSSTPGEVYHTGSFSPDGRMIAFTSTRGGAKNIWVKQTTSGDAVEITKDEFSNDTPIWSPNGDEIAFFSLRGNQYGIWRVPALGGAPQLMKTLPLGQGDAKLRYWSKQHKVYYESNQNFFALDSNSGRITQLTNLDSVVPWSLSISPDEQRVAYLSWKNGHYSLWQMPARGGPSSQLTPDDPAEERNAVFHPDGKRILYCQKVDGTFQIFLAYAEGRKPTQLTFGDQDSFVLDVSPDGSRVLYGSTKEESDIWGVNVAKAEEFAFATDITAELWPDVSPDGNRIAYQAVKNLSQGDKIFNCSILAKGRRSADQSFQLSADGFLPRWSPDGKQLAFMRLIGEKFSIWTVNATGGEERQTTIGGLPPVDFTVLPYNRYHESDFSWSPDSSKIAYCSSRTGQHNIWLGSADGSSDTQITDNTDPNLLVYCPLWSYDGRRIAYASANDVSPDGTLVYTVWAIDMQTKHSKAVFQSNTFVRLIGWSEGDKDLILATGRSRGSSPTEVGLIQVSVDAGRQRSIGLLAACYLYNIHLSVDKKTIAFTSERDGKHNLYVMPLIGGEARRLTNNSDPTLYFSSVSWSPDGQAIFFGRQSRRSLLSMITNFK